MALWTDSMKCLWVGRSGLQYRRSVPCSVPPDVAADIVTRFFSDRQAVQDAGGNARAMTFTRGHVWDSWLSWLLFCSEKSPRQTIAVSIRRDGDDTTVVDVSYNVRMLFTFVMAPNALEKEARELQCLLQPE